MEDPSKARGAGLPTLRTPLTPASGFAARLSW